MLEMIRTRNRRNRFERQVMVCQGLGLGFGALGDILPQTERPTWPTT
jgi:hypothetical protein